jgi:hypothetical protein
MISSARGLAFTLKGNASASFVEVRQNAWSGLPVIVLVRCAFAARFFDRSEATKTFKRGMGAHNNPQFYRQLGKDPDLLLSAALELLARKFSL